MPEVLHVDTRALSSTSPSGRTSFWPWNSGCSYRIQLWAQRAKGHRVGGCTQSLVGLLQASPPSSPPGSQPGPPPPWAPTYQPRTTLTEATGAQPEASAVSPQTSLLLPWQPGSEKRVTWENTAGVLRPCPRALPPASLHLPPISYLPRPGVQLALGLQCWALEQRGRSKSSGVTTSPTLLF